ncbi:MAG TPA: ferredoxin [Candidatus Nanoarchaeia archaeon]|nr:ferredoxin [Candidatus Nanoarchaeia archaeon]
MGKQYRIVYKRNECIGAGPCMAVAPEFWTLNEANDGRANIIKAKEPKNLDNGDQELIIDEKDLQANMEAAEGCPVNVIHIYELDTGKQLI